MPVYLSDDSLTRCVETFEHSQPLHDARANEAFIAGVRWLARRWFITPTYRMVFALVRELAVRDRMAYGVRDVSITRSRLVMVDGVKQSSPASVEIEDLFAALADRPHLLRTASKLAQAAYCYYESQDAKCSVPRAVTPAPERADAQRVVE